MRSLAYIPARGGSKGILKKNIHDLSGTPLIAYTIQAAKASCLFDMVFVSTDSEEIASIAKLFGAEVPFLRYPEFATDTARTIDAVVSDVARLKEIGRVFDTFCLLQPTSPLRTVKDLCSAFQIYENVARLKNEGVVSVTPVEEHPVLMRTLNEDGSLSRILNIQSTVRRQDMPSVYRVNGAIYINSIASISSQLSFNDNAFGYVMEKRTSVDIDTLEDLQMAINLLDDKSSKEGRL